MFLYVCKQTFPKLYRYIIPEFLGIRMWNFHCIISVWTWTYREIFKSALVQLRCARIVALGWHCSQEVRVPSFIEAVVIQKSYKPEYSYSLIVSIWCQRILVLEIGGKSYVVFYECWECGSIVQPCKLFFLLTVKSLRNLQLID